ncbi:MAG: hypothetical protein ACSHXY_07440 [Alphaproteobacteria bacterium]
MTEYEHTILFLEFAQAASSVMANYMALVFAMIVTSYMAAHRLDRLMTGIALTIYSLFALGFCNEIFQLYSDLSRLGISIADMGNNPSTSLTWFGPIATGPDFLHILPEIIGGMIVLAYFGSILFFFRARKSNLSNAVGPVNIAEIINENTK